MNIGLYGLGVMGQSLAINISRNYNICVYDYFDENINRFLKRSDITNNIQSFYNLDKFIQSLSRPRNIILMVTAGDVVDDVIGQLVNKLDKGDTIIDCGNTFYKDTIRRAEYLDTLGIKHLGIGVSGGEYGALNGASLMISGDKYSYQNIADIFHSISAIAKDGKPCCNYLGTHGVGHFVKMVHNGIEYADIQLISEVYYILKYVLKLTNDNIHKVFIRWNEGVLRSYLINITSDILKTKDDMTGLDLIDVILDKAAQNGTGKWTAVNAIEIGVVAPTIIEAVNSRFLSCDKNLRVYASDIFVDLIQEYNFDNDTVIATLEKALYSAKILCYAQGFDLLKKASEKYNWELNLSDISMIWREGCIIKSDILDEIANAYSNNTMENLILSDKFQLELQINIHYLRTIAVMISQYGVYAPALTSSMSYFDGVRCSRMGSNLIQAQRDYFGSHKYERVDMPGLFHSTWNK